MGMMVGGKRGIVSEMNVVPLIDILLVLLVIFMIIPAHYKGLDALIPQQSTQPPEVAPPSGVIVVQVLADGTLRINQEPVAWEALGGRNVGGCGQAQRALRGAVLSRRMVPGAGGSRESRGGAARGREHLPKDIL